MSDGPVVKDKEHAEDGDDSKDNVPEIAMAEDANDINNNNDYFSYRPIDSVGSTPNSRLTTPQVVPRLVTLTSPDYGESSQSVHTSLKLPVYPGSYLKSSTSLSSHWHAKKPSTPGEIPGFRGAASQVDVERIMSLGTEYRDTYGLEELRNGFFDAIFIQPTLIEKKAYKEASEKAEQPLTSNAFSYFEVIVGSFIRDVLLTRGGMILTKSFISFFVAYVLCLVEPTSNWLGEYCFLAPVVTILMHSGRPTGSQLEIVIESILGGALGIGWGSLAMYVSISTGPAKRGYGGLHACSLIIGILISSWFRAAYIRLYHGIISFSIAILFFDLVAISATPNWRMAWDFGIPSLFGVLISIVINVVMFPDAGHIPMMNAIRKSLEHCQSAVRLCVSTDEDARRGIRRDLDSGSLKFSASFREMSNEISLSTFSTKEALAIRNAIQLAISRLRTIPSPGSLYMKTTVSEGLVNELRKTFAQPSQILIQNILLGLDNCLEYVEYMRLGQKPTGVSYSEKLKECGDKITESMQEIVNAYSNIPVRGSAKTDSSDMMDIMLYMHYLYETSKYIFKVVEEFLKLSKQQRTWKLSLPIYPLSSALYFTTAQIMHDRGGESAAYFYFAKRKVEESFRHLHEVKLQPKTSSQTKQKRLAADKLTDNNGKLSDAQGVRYSVWLTMHRLQDYEARFAIKSSITTAILSIPAWIPDSNGWYQQYDVWLSVLIAYLSLHPRVGGNVSDLLVRSAFCISGSVWAGIGFKAMNGNPYVLAVFCAIFMIPSMYRFILTGHPRSGLFGCMSFTIVSLQLVAQQQRHGPINVFKECWTRLVSLEVGLLVAVVISWLFWPFVARHEVRKFMSVLLSNISKCYQIVSDSYIYRDGGFQLTDLSLQLSEVRESRMRESIKAFETLLELTQHEPSIRGDFDQEPYRKLARSCAIICQKIADARISSIHFNIYENDRNAEATKRLLALRRDAVASVLFLLYILSGAFRSKNQVPKLLPSAVMSRKLLFDLVQELDVRYSSGHLQEETTTSTTSVVDDSFDRVRENDIQLWRRIHELAFSSAFTDITEELEKIIAYSKYILGER